MSALQADDCNGNKRQILAMENKFLKWAILTVFFNAIAMFVAGGAWYVLKSDVSRMKTESSLTQEKIETIEKNVWKIIHRMGIE